MSEENKRTEQWNQMVMENEYLNDLIQNIQLRKKLKQLEKEAKEELEKESVVEQKQESKKEILHG